MRSRLLFDWAKEEDGVTGTKVFDSLVDSETPALRLRGRSTDTTKKRCPVFRDARDLFDIVRETEL
jgi:hypothetical protein